jgi:hypothetical protein
LNLSGPSIYVTINGYNTPVTGRTPTQIIVYTPACTCTGPRDVAVTTINGTTTVVGGYTYEIWAPASISAYATSPNSVSITWSSVTASPEYSVERSSNGTTFVEVAHTSGPSSTFATDSSVSPNTAYLYRVHGFYSAPGGGPPGPNSANDLATTVIFMDDPLVAGTTIKGAHITELRTAVDAVRILAGMSAGTYNPITAGVTTVDAAHINELRTNLDAARAALSLGTMNYGDTLTPGTTVIKAVHVTGLRIGVK